MTASATTSRFFPIPHSPFKGWIKQIRSEMLQERSRGFLEITFPGFTRELGEVNPRILTPLQEFSAGRLRRYAGTTQLPPGQYFTIAQDASGNDGGTLVAELMSYWNEDARLMAWITDPTVPGHGDAEVRAEVQAEFGDQPCLCISMAEVLGLEQNTVQLGPEFMLVVPTVVIPVDATHVLDLRRPQAQDWFCTAFGALECKLRQFGGWAKLKPADFREILPTLLHPAPGGIAFHHGVGAWLASHGISALIYPSARRDVSVAAQDQNVVSHDGWNLVGFGGPQGQMPKPADYESQFGFLGKWLEGTDTDIELDWQETPQARCWRVTGVESREVQRRQSSTLKVLENKPEKSGWLRERLEALGFDCSENPAGDSRRVSTLELFNQ